MSSSYNPGRVAGFLYLLLVVIAPFRLIYIPSTLIVPGNATATANNIAAHQLLFRLGIVADLFCGTILIFLVLALYRLLKGVDQNHAVTPPWHAWLAREINSTQYIKGAHSRCMLTLADLVQIPWRQFED